jgi:hypothetical protein
MTMTEPHRLLSRTVAGLEIDNLSPECRAWLLEGLRLYLAGSGELDACLHLQPVHGKRSVATSALLDKRDGYIKALAFVLPGEILDQAGQVAAFISGGVETPPGIPTELMTKILSLGVRVPKNPIHIWRILRGDRSR